jgi:hypothetical protein
MAAACQIHRAGVTRKCNVIGWQDAGMRLDHLSYACTTSELADVVQRIGSELGATFRDGGLHPSFGTRNFILPLAGNCYIEIVAALDHPAVEKAPFGRAVKEVADEGGGWLTWVVAVDDLAPWEAKLGRSAQPGHRVRPDGYELRWRQIGVLDVMVDRQLPFFIAWDTPPAEHPSHGDLGTTVARLELTGDSERICAWLDAPVAKPLEGVEVEWVESDEPGIQAVWFKTPNGMVRVD